MADVKHTPVPLAADHTGMRVDYLGLFGQSQRGLRYARDTANAEMLRQFTEHMTELGNRFYSGDIAAVDEFLQLYCVGRDARASIAKATVSVPDCTCQAKDMPFGRCCKAAIGAARTTEGSA